MTLGVSTARHLLHRLGFDVTRYRNPADTFPHDFDEQTIATVRAVREYTMTTPIRVFALCEAVRYLLSAGIAGAFVECGVWRGGSMMAVARTLLDVGETSRELYLFDTFEGMTAPTPQDVDPAGRPAVATFGEDGKGKGGGTPWAPASLDDVRKAMSSTGYDDSKVHLVKGRVEESIPAQAPDQVALLRLDTDWYESTRHELVHLYSRIAPGGVLILDDYGYWQGARRAVDEFLSEHGVALLLNRIDESCRVAVKSVGGAA